MNSVVKWKKMNSFNLKCAGAVFLMNHNRYRILITAVGRRRKRNLTLDHEIDSAARQVSTDSFSITIGEVANMYQDGDVVINPEFQRLFRWDIARKSRLIESVLVRIPLPPIFVFELPNSKWEVIDGLQRLSTILEFMGELRDSDGNKCNPDALIGTQYLPSLRGAFWSQDLLRAQLERDEQRSRSGDITYFDNSSSYHVIGSDLQRAIKRAKIGVQLLEKKSDSKSKYDLFQRLNSGGMIANDQELRNSSLVMVNPEFYRELRAFAEDGDFSKLIPLGANSIRKSNHLDNLSKVFAFTFREYTDGTDIEEYVTNAMISIAENPKDSKNCFDVATKAITLLIEACGVNALRPYNDGQFVGRIGRTSQEIILSGVMYNIDEILKAKDPASFVRARIIAFWESQDSKRFSAAGISGTDRVRFTIPYGRKLFAA